MEKEKDINRIKVVLVERKRTNKWLAEQLGKDPATVSKWCTNTSYDMDISQPIKVYVFSPSEDPWEGSFDDVSDKVELCALPQAIYNTYRRILPKKKDAVVFPEEDVLATTEKKEEQFNGMLNFEYNEEV